MATDELAELRARVDALEQASTLPSYTPLTGLKVAADGSTTSDFDGHVHARGLDLDAGATSTPPDDRKVRWIRADGAVVAELYGDADPASIAVGAILSAPPVAGKRSDIYALAGAASTLILNSNDISGYVRTLSPTLGEDLRMTWTGSRLNFYAGATQVASLPLGYNP